MENKQVIELEVDETLTKQLKFIGLIQQVIGVFGIIGGAVMCLTIIGAAAGVPYLMGALNLFKSGGAMGDTARTNSGLSLKEAISNLAKGMKLLLIGLIIWFVLYILFIIVIMTISMIAASQQY